MNDTKSSASRSSAARSSASRASNRLAAYAALSAAVAATGTATAAVQYVTAGFPQSTSGANTPSLVINVGAVIFNSTGSSSRQVAFVRATGGVGGNGLQASNLIRTANSSNLSILSTLRGTAQMVQATGLQWATNFAVWPDNLFTTTKYVGFRATKNSATHYGWFEVSFDSGNSRYTVSRWAYESTAGAGLPTPGTPSAVPGGTGLAALAIGAAGLRGRRRSRN